MKRLVLCFVLVFGLVQFCNLVAQEEQVDQVFVGSIRDIKAKVTSDPGEVLALGVAICDSSYTPYSVIEYKSGDIWYMALDVVNLSTATKSIKIEFDIRYADGANYKVVRDSDSIAGQTEALFIYNATSYVAKGGLLSLSGRVYGAKMGNDNRVTGRTYVY